MSSKQARGGPKYLDRFTGRAADYSRYRPGYPAEILDHLREEIGLDSSWLIADVGSGTGILSELFLKNGNTVFCVEPNGDMRRAAEKNLEKYRPLFVSVDGSAEATLLRANSIDLVVAGQALHWFDLKGSRAEFGRILRRKGHIAIVYNHRKKGRGVMTAYEKLIKKYRGSHAPDTPDVDDAYVRRFFGKKAFRTFVLPTSQTLSLTGLLGRIASASYVPPKGSLVWNDINEDVKKIVDHYGHRGMVTMCYDTTVYLGRIS